MNQESKKIALASKNARAGKMHDDVPGWLDLTLLLRFEKELVEMIDKLGRFGSAETNGNSICSHLILNDKDFIFFCDENFIPIAAGDCVFGRHAMTIQVQMRKEKLFGYSIRGKEPKRFYAKVFGTTSIPKKAV